MTRVVLASHNRGKLAEMRRILADVAGVDLVGLDDVATFDEPAETEPTFEGNALLKARVAYESTGIATLADDSGLCVDVLNGMPGVRSARWAGPDKDDLANNELLLAQLVDVPDSARGAEFRCAVALCRTDGSHELTLGVMRGRILREMRGSGGFGYDVLFAAEGQQLSAAELDAEAKDAISHRGRALRAMVPHLRGL
jgi:XTP/dITP diphosphohydrolase